MLLSGFIMESSSYSNQVFLGKTDIFPFEQIQTQDPRLYPIRFFLTGSTGILHGDSHTLKIPWATICLFFPWTCHYFPAGGAPPLGFAPAGFSPPWPGLFWRSLGTASRGSGSSRLASWASGIAHTPTTV